MLTDRRADHWWDKRLKMFSFTEGPRSNVHFCDKKIKESVLWKCGGKDDSQGHLDELTEIRLEARPPPAHWGHVHMVVTSAARVFTYVEGGSPRAHLGVGVGGRAAEGATTPCPQGHLFSLAKGQK